MGWIQKVTKHPLNLSAEAFLAIDFYASHKFEPAFQDPALMFTSKSSAVTTSSFCGLGPKQTVLGESPHAKSYLHFPHLGSLSQK